MRRAWAKAPSSLFFSEAGNTLDESRVRKIMARTCERAAIAKRTPYDLRHTFATLLLSGQAPGLDGRPAPLTYVSSQLGHAKPTTTLAWYAHWIPNESSVRYVDALDARVTDDFEDRSDAILAPTSGFALHTRN